jgi:hypothetical protein
MYRAMPTTNTRLQTQHTAYNAQDSARTLCALGVSLRECHTRRIARSDPKRDVCVYCEAEYVRNDKLAKGRSAVRHGDTLKMFYILSIYCDVCTRHARFTVYVTVNQVLWYN